jgi:hypothetical protein
MSAYIWKFPIGPRINVCAGPKGSGGREKERRTLPRRL